MAKSRLTPDYIEWVLRLNADEAAREMHKLNEANKELSRQQNATRQAMVKLEAEGKKGSKEWQNLKKSVKDYGDQIKTNNEKLKELDKRLDVNQMSAAQLKKKLKDLHDEFRNTSKAIDPKRYRELQREIDQTQRAYVRAADATRGFSGALHSLSKLKSVLQGFFMGIGSQLLSVVLNGFRESVNVIIDFEKANSKLAGVLGSTKAGIAGLTDEARRLGATTAYTASEVTGLQVELAKLGFGEGQIKAMEEAILKFALAVDTDLGSAASVAGGALRAFGLEAEEAESAMATLAIGTTTSALSFNDYATMLSTTAPVAKAFGFTLEDTVALMGALKNANFDASSAATATRNILLNLADGSGKLATALGGPVTNLDELAAGLKKLQAEGIDLATALELTDKRSVAAFETFINNADTLTTLRQGVTDCTDAFNGMYKEMGDNVQGSINILKSTFEGLILEFYEGKGVVKVLIDSLTVFLNVIKELITFSKEHTKVIIAAIAAWTGYNAVVNFAIIKQKLLAAVTLESEAATIRLNKTLKRSLWGLLGAAIAAVIVFIIDFIKKTTEATAAQKAMNDAEREATEQYRQKESNINRLIAVAKNENISLKQRKAAVDELNKIVPKYNARIDATTGKYIANKKALDALLESLKKEMLYKSYMKQREQLVDATVKAEMDLIQATKDVEDARQKHNNQIGKTIRTTGGAGPAYDPYANKYYKEGEYGQAALRDANKKLSQANKAVKEFDAMLNTKLENGEIVVPGTGERIKEQADAAADAAERAGANIDKTNDGLHTTVDRLKEINSELKQLRKADPQTDEEFEQIQAKIKALTEEKNKLMGKGGKTGKHGKNGKNGTPGTYKEDSLDEVTAPLDLEHQRNMLNLNKRKAELTEAELIIKKSEEIIRYENEVKNALQDLADKTDATHTKTLDKIKKQQEQSEANILAAQEAINNARVSQDDEYYGKRMEALKAYNNGIQDFMQQALNKGVIQEEQAGIYRLNSTRLLHQEELKELQQHLAEIGQKDYYTAEQCKKVQEDLNKQIVTKNRELLADISSIQQKIAEMTSDPVGLDGLERNLEREKAAVAAAYDAMVEVARQNGLDTIELERSKLQKLRDLEFEYQEELWGIREQLGLSWQQEYDRELAQYQKLKDDELISEKEFQKKKQELQAQNVKRYFDYYSGAASSMFEAIQQAEIDMSDAKYDELIRQAENAGEDTAALEEEKENKKLEIQKKYADVNFAIKVSQIVADTAVSIMKAFADLGPIGGAIAAAMLTATGVAQVISAKAERDKVKRLQPKSSGAGSATGTAERVLSGYSEGGYTGDGRRLEVAGVVHRGEYVVPQPIMGDPRVVDAVGMIEAIRRQRRGAPWQSPGPRDTGAGGYSEGGYTGGGAEAGELAGVAAELRAATEAVRNLRAYIVYQDIERAGEVLTQARAPFTRKK